jgi:hypothetical protein
LKAEGEFEFISWKLPKGLKVERVGDREFLFTGPAGSYTFEAVASSKEGITGFERSLIVIGDGKATPTPDDRKQPAPPIPPDPPGPAKGKVAWLIVIEETSQRTPETAKVLADIAGWNGLGPKWRFYDVDDAYAKTAGYKRTADKANVALPALLLISDKGDAIQAVPLPKSTADVKAKEMGYRSRAAFKLLELNEQFQFLKPGAKIADLGAAPGGWMQVALPLIGKKGKIVAIDIQEIEPMEGVQIFKADIKDLKTIDLVKNALGGEADVVMSDMAPASTPRPGRTPTPRRT